RLSRRTGVPQGPGPVLHPAGRSAPAAGPAGPEGGGAGLPGRPEALAGAGRRPPGRGRIPAGNGHEDTPRRRTGIARPGRTRLGDLYRPDEQTRARAVAAYREAIVLWKRLAAVDPAAAEYRRDLAWTQSNVGELVYRPAQPQEAESAYREAVQNFQQLAADF